MSDRARTVAAAPVRSPAETWSVISALLAATLGKSDRISATEVVSELQVLDTVGPMLVAGGHLENKGLVLVAAAMRLTITTTAGNAALAMDENLNAVPGAAEALDWALYIPESPPLTSWITSAVSGQPHLHVGRPDESDRGASTAGSFSPVVDLAAFSSRKKESP